MPEYERGPNGCGPSADVQSVRRVPEL